MHKIEIQLTERAARQALAAVSEQVATTRVLQAQMRQLQMVGEAAQRKLNETLEAILAAHDSELPDAPFDTRVVGTTLELLVHDDTPAPVVAPRNGVHESAQ